MKAIGSISIIAYVTRKIDPIVMYWWYNHWYNSNKINMFLDLHKSKKMKNYGQKKLTKTMKTMTKKTKMNLVVELFHRLRLTLILVLTPILVHRLIRRLLLIRKLLHILYLLHLLHQHRLLHLLHHQGNQRKQLKYIKGQNDKLKLVGYVILFHI